MAVVANLIHDAPKGAFDYLIYPNQHPANKQYIVNQLDAYTHLLLDTGKQYFSQAREMYERINDSESIRAAKAALRMAKGIVRPNVVIELTSLEDIRSAQPIMQRYIMAEPKIRQMYIDQRIDGYSDTYIDAFSNILGKDHLDFQMVMTGMIEEFVDDEGEDSWRTTMWAFDVPDGDVELTFENKVDIRHTWTLALAMLEAGEDCTDKYGGRL